MDCSLPGSSVHGILQARILEWVAVSFSGGLPDPGVEPPVLMSPALVGGFFATSATWEAVGLFICLLLGQTDTFWLGMIQSAPWRWRGLVFVGLGCTEGQHPGLLGASGRRRCSLSSLSVPLSKYSPSILLYICGCPCVPLCLSTDSKAFR